MRYTSVDLTIVPHKLRRLVQDELRPDERLLWVGQPDPRRQALGMLPLVLFGFVFTGMALFIGGGPALMSLGLDNMLGDADMPAPPGPFSICFALFLLPFVLVGLVMVTSPLWAMRTAKRTVYVVTDQRAVIFRQMLGMRIKSYDADDFTDYERIERGGGRGDIVFSRQLYHSSKGRVRSRQEGFFGIEGVRDVDRLLQDIMEGGDRAERG